MTLSQIYSQFTRGSQGFCRAVETHCGFNTSMDETKRIADKAETAEDFERIWESDDNWTDEKNQ